VDIFDSLHLKLLLEERYIW